MLKYKKVFITAITILGMLTLGGTLKGQANVIKSARHYNLRVLKSGAKSRKNLIAKDSQVKQKYLKKSYQLDELAKVGHQNYFQISRRGKPLGCVNAKYLKKQSVYKLPYTYTSQLYPLYAPNACEAASLKMALSVKGIALKTSLKKIITDMPKSSNPNKGFVGNPYKDSPRGVTWTIYPKPLTRYAQVYDNQAVNITGASKNQLISEIKRGNAVVFSAAWNMDLFRPYHVLAMVGYKQGHFLVADPYMQKGWSGKTKWFSTKRVMAAYKSRHLRAVAIR